MPEQYQPVNGDPFAVSAVSLQPVEGDPFAAGSVNPQTTPQGSMPYDLQGQSIAAYNPTWREKAAQWLYGDQPRSPEAQATIRGLVGTTGLGTPQMSVADLTPVGGVFASQEAARRGDYSGAGVAALGALPGFGAIDRAGIEAAGAVERGATNLANSAAPGLDEIISHLSPDEAAKVTARNKDTLLSTFNQLPSADEMAATAWAGRAKRGWYGRSEQALTDIFGDEDAPRFARLLAATSPQTSVESNLTNTIHTWINWDQAGRPTDKDSIVKILGQSVQGGGGVDSVLPAWINNAHTALSSDAPLSGPKVHSFAGNLSGDPNAVTNDTWMANWGGIEQKQFAKSGAAPGFGAGYNAMSAKTRMAADMLSEMTGEPWSPREVQETVWSLSKSLYEKARGAGQTAQEMLPSLTHGDIAGTPDFHQLFAQPEYSQALSRGGYNGQQIAGTEGAGAAGLGASGGSSYGSYAPEGSVASAQGGPFSETAFAGHLQNVAARLDALAAKRAADKAATIAGGGTSGGGAGEAVLGSGPIRQAAEKLEPVTGDPFTPITAYHGSPHDFDAFDMSKIGTGEGAQAYGHGLYFAGNEGVARSYRDNLVFDPKNEVNDIISEGAKYPWQDQDSFVRGKLSLTPGMQPHATEENIGLIKRAIAGQEAGGTVTPDAMSAYRQLTNNIPPNPGKMYQVQINADPNHFLDWDKPLSEQHPVVQQGAQQVLDSLGFKGAEPQMTWGELRNSYINPMKEILQGTQSGRFVPPENFFHEGQANIPLTREELASNPAKLQQFDTLMSKYQDATKPNLGGIQGADILDAIAAHLPDQAGDNLRYAAGVPTKENANASELLRQAGIPGIKYLDAGSRGTGEGTSNYVVFDHNIIDILKKYGIGGLGIGTAAGLKHFQTQPVNGDPYSNGG